MTKDFQTPAGDVFVRTLDLDASKDQIHAEIVSLLESRTGIANLQIEHTDTGKPFILGNENLLLSISHAQNHIAVYLSENNPVGIDIEIENPQIRNARSRFVNAAEEIIFQQFTMEDLHLVWGAKEAIYKYYGGQFISLENEVTILEIDRVSSKILAETTYGEIRCAYEISDPGIYLAWTV